MKVKDINKIISDFFCNFLQVFHVSNLHSRAHRKVLRISRDSTPADVISVAHRKFASTFDSAKTHVVLALQEDFTLASAPENCCIAEMTSRKFVVSKADITVSQARWLV